MANTVEMMALMLARQLKRLDALDASDGEKIAAECMRSKAMNETAKTVAALGALHLQAEAARDAAEVSGSFNPGMLFAPVGQAADDGRRTRKLDPGSAVTDGGRTRMNALGEFEVDEDDGWGREVGA